MKQLMLTFIMGVMLLSMSNAQYRMQRSNLIEKYLYENNSSNANGDYNENIVGDKKNIIFSAILPGSGQFIEGNYVKGGIFIGLEVAGWALWSVYYGKGGSKQDEFEDFADKHWAINRYEEIRDLVVEKSDGMLYELRSRFAVYDTLSHVWSYSPAYFAINYTKNQHFYEDIGKYEKYWPGWDDWYANFNWTDDDWDNWVQQVNNDSLLTFPQSVHKNRDYYVSLRDESNKNYAKARLFLNLILVNHIASALDIIFFGGKKSNETVSGLYMGTEGVGYSYKNWNVNFNPQISINSNPKLSFKISKIFN